MRFPNDPLEGRTEDEQRAVLAIYHELLSDMPALQLDAACRRVTQTARFFPKPGDVHAAIEGAAANALKLEAEEAWERALRFAMQSGFTGNRQLDAHTMHAARAAGGLHWMESCPEKELQWTKKRFIEDYILLRETREAEHLLSDGEAKRILHELAAQSNQHAARALAPIAEASRKPLAPNDSIPAEAAAAPQVQPHRPEPKPPMTDAEFESRQELLKRQAIQILQKATTV